MRNYEQELKNRVAFLQKALRESGARGFVYGNSGGKDSALVGILCKKACDNTLGIILPCQSSRNFGEDRDHGRLVAQQFGIEQREVDLSGVKAALLEALSPVQEVTPAAAANIAPRLRMTTLYAAAQSRGALVAGTGNRSEGYVGYFTKWGDGAYDVNPIGDLTVAEVYDFLRYLGAPEAIIRKAPSAGLFEGQTDEKELGFSYAQLDRLLLEGETDREAQEKIERMHRASEHKRRPAMVYSDGSET